MIRYSLLAMFLFVLWAYAYRDWFTSLCGLILMTVITQNANFPSSMLSIPGLNPWNISVVIITLFWARERLAKPNPWHAPIYVQLILLAYIFVLVAAFAQLAARIGDIQPQEDITSKDALMDYLINPLKYVWVSILLADGCNSSKRLQMALATTLGVGVLYGLLVVKHTPLGVLGGGGKIMRYRHLIDKMVGLHANDMARVFVTTFWGLLTCIAIWPYRYTKAATVGALALMLIGTAMCFSRAGYVTFILLGMLFATLRYRSLLIIGPVALVAVVMIFPSVRERATMDLFQNEVTQETDLNTLTAGRTGNLWPPVIDAVRESPFVGYGRLAMYTTSVYGEVMATEGVVPTSPHNGYLQAVLEAGFIGGMASILPYLFTAIVSISLLRNRTLPLARAAGGLGLSVSAGCLIAGLSGSMFWPDQGLLTIMCGMGIAARTWCATSRTPSVA
jgi:hypothetical protein